MLVRSFAENYFAMKYVGRCQSYTQVLLAQMKLGSGTHSYKVTPNGKTEYSKIVSRETGEVFAVLTTKHMARSLDAYDGSLYEDIYSATSQAVHARPSEALHFFDGAGLAWLDTDFSFSVLLNAHTLCLATTCHLLTRKCQRYLHKDLQTCAKKSLFALAVAIASLPKERTALRLSLVKLVPTILNDGQFLAAHWEKLNRSFSFAGVQ